MLSNGIGIAGLLLSLLPLIAPSIGTRRLKAAIASHSPALEFIDDPRVKEAYRTYIADLSWDLLTRTVVVVGRGRLLLPALWVVCFLALGYAQARNAVRGVMTAGLTEGEAWVFVLSSGRLLAFSLAPGLLFVGGLACALQSYVAFRRAAYVSLRYPGSDAFHRFVRIARIYALSLTVPILAVVVAIIVLPLIRAWILDGLAGMPFRGVWLVIFPLMGLMLAGLVWHTLYLPVAAPAQKLRRLGTLQQRLIERRFESLRSGLPLVYPELEAAKFVRALNSRREEVVSGW